MCVVSHCCCVNEILRLSHWLIVYHEKHERLLIWLPSLPPVINELFNVIISAAVKARLTRLPQVPHICVSELSQHWLRYWLVAYMVPRHYLNWCCIFVNWTPRNKFQSHFNQNTTLFINENAFENIVGEMAAILSTGRWVKNEPMRYLNIWYHIMSWKIMFFICNILLHQCILSKDNKCSAFMMLSWHGNAFSVADTLWGGIHQSLVDYHHKGPVMWSKGVPFVVE